MMNKDDKNWVKKYAKDVFKNKNKRPEKDNDSGINISFVSCTNENSKRPKPDMEYLHDYEIYIQIKDKSKRPVLMVFFRWIKKNLSHKKLYLKNIENGNNNHINPINLLLK